MNFRIKDQGVKREKIIIFCKLNVKDDNVFNLDIYTITIKIKIFACS